MIENVGAAVTSCRAAPASPWPAVRTGRVTHPASVAAENEMSEAYPILEAGPLRGTSIGTLEHLNDLWSGAPTATDSLRAISIGRESRAQGSPRLFKTTLLDKIARAAQTLTRPSAAVRKLLMTDLANARPGPARLFYVLEQNGRVRSIPLKDFATAAQAWKDLNSIFLLEINAADAARVRSDVDPWLHGFDQVIAPLTVRPPPATVRSEVSTSVRIIEATGSNGGLAPPVAAALGRRDALRMRAHDERWPDSAAAGRLLGSSSDAGGKQKAFRERAALRLLGVRSAPDRTLYHPPFQFTDGGTVRPEFIELLQTLAENPALTHEQDANGWNRLSWLTRRRTELSERGLAEAAAADGVPEHEDTPDDTARTPETVFASDPAAVIALAREDAEAAHGRL